MSIRKIIFCDICNPQALRSVEFRRAPRDNDRGGRRISDGRSWIEGELSNSIDYGWLATSDGRHICPICQARSKQNLPR
jgi:hypothetical protein